MKSRKTLSPIGADLGAMADRAQRNYQPGDPRTGDSGGIDQEYAEGQSKGTEGWTEGNDRDHIPLELEDQNTYLFSIVLEQTGTSKGTAWDALIDSITDDPRGIIGPDYHAAWEPEAETNAQRVERVINSDYTEDTGTNISLLLADLRQLCDREGWNFAQLNRDAREIYERELPTKGLVKRRV